MVREATDGHGADVILDTIGAKYLARNVGLLAVNGRLVVIGLQGGRTGRDRPRGDARQALRAGRDHPPGEAGGGEGGDRRGGPGARLAAHRSPVGSARSCTRAYPLGDAAGAHREMEASTHVGKLLLRV